MNSEVESKLNKYLFPVQEKQVYFEVEDGSAVLAPAYKAITREDDGKLISVMSDTYKLVPNAEIIKPLMEQLANLDNKWYIDDSHSFVSKNRMRLQVTFPELTFNDGRSDIALSLFLHNSYDGSEGIRMLWGAIRFLCSNGMILGTVLSKFYARHTKGINPNNISEQLHQTYDQIPIISERISILQNLDVPKSLTESIEKKLGKHVIKHVQEQPVADNQWVLYNYLTYYISHVVEKRLRAAYQMQVSRMFGL